MARPTAKDEPRNHFAVAFKPKGKIPPDAQKAGAMLMSKTLEGQSIAMRVHEVKEKTIVVDLNHPLAGKTLNFDVKVTDIKAAEAK